MKAVVISSSYHPPRQIIRQVDGNNPVNGTSTSSWVAPRKSFTWCYCLLCLGFLMPAANAWSQGNELADCPGNVPINQDECLRRHFQEADAELNRTYKDIMGGLNPEKKKALRKEQRAWLKTLERDCAEKADEEAGQGTLWSFVAAVCEMEEKRSRTAKLKLIWSD